MTETQKRLECGRKRRELNEKLRELEEMASYHRAELRKAFTAMWLDGDENQRREIAIKFKCLQDD